MPKVLLDSDIAELYGVETKTLVRAVIRNRDRFPIDFMFQLTMAEWKDLRSQFGTSSSWGGRRYVAGLAPATRLSRTRFPREFLQSVFGDGAIHTERLLPTEASRTLAIGPSI